MPKPRPAVFEVRSMRTLFAVFFIDIAPAPAITVA